MRNIRGLPKNFSAKLITMLVNDSLFAAGQNLSRLQTYHQNVKNTNGMKFSSVVETGPTVAVILHKQLYNVAVKRKLSYKYKVFEQCVSVYFRVFCFNSNNNNNIFQRVEATQVEDSLFDSALNFHLETSSKCVLQPYDTCNA